MSVSILVPCLNEQAYIGQFLRSALLLKNFGPDDEILILDGMSSDGTRDVVLEAAALDSRIRLVDNPGRTQAKAMNLGLAASKGDIIIRMDVHTEYSSEYIQQCLSVLEVTGASNVGGPALTRWKTPFQHANALAYHSPFCVGGAAFHDPDAEGLVDNVPYGCWHRSTLTEINGYDERFARNEDDELNYRIIRSGGTVYLSPRIKSWYYPRASFSTLFRQYEQYGYWKVAIIRKHHLPAKFRHLIPAIFVGFLTSLPLWLLIGGILLDISIITLLLYTFLLIFATWKATKDSPWNVKVMVPLIIATYHLAYGVGFWSGIYYFLIKGRAFETAGRTSLTR